MKRRLRVIFLGIAAVAMMSPTIGCAATPNAESGNDPVAPPQIVRETPANEGSLVRLADDRLVLFFTDMETSQVLTIASEDDGRTWSEPRIEFETGRTHHGIYAFLDRDGAVHVLYLDKHGKGKINVDYTINVLHRVSTGNAFGDHTWSEPTVAFEGYTGSLRGGLQLDSGRLLVPIGAWNHPSDTIEPDTGNNSVTFVVSDDNGETWERLPIRMTAPVYAGYNGSNYGAVEPSFAKLGDGRLWLLFRTQAGYMYESFSPDGTTWSKPAPSRFAASNSPAEITTLNDGRLVVFWNNSAMPPRFNGDGVYGGRDALSAAISDDHGLTWRGFREVFRDPTRHDTPPRKGDRGTAYPTAVQASDGHIVLTTGQGEHVRRILRIDPDWLTQTPASDDFADGLDGWHVFTEVGPAERWWRDRKAGASVVEEPSAAGGRALWLRRPADSVGDGAVWNFPGAASGRIELRFRVMKEGGDGYISLADRFFNPTDDTSPGRAIYSVKLTELPGVTPNVWHTLTMTWDAASQACRLEVDGQPAGTRDAQFPTANGPCYLMLRNTADATDEKGWQVGSVSMSSAEAPAR